MQRRLSDTHNLEAVSPELAAQWDFSKNGDITPKDVTPGSGRKVWWRCGNGHEWEASILSRMHGSGCPYCSNHIVLKGFNDLETTNPELAKDWHPTKNGTLKPSDVMAGSGRIVWWRCEKGHEWPAQVSLRKSQSQGCPYCSGHRVQKGVNDLQTLRPDVAATWHPTRNDRVKVDEVTQFSNRKAWWLCPTCGCEWVATIASRSQGKGCPVCGNKRKGRRKTD